MDYVRRTRPAAAVLRLALVLIPFVLMVALHKIGDGFKYVAERLDDLIGFIADHTPSPEVMVPVGSAKDEDDDFWNHGV